VQTRAPCCNRGSQLKDVCEHPNMRNTHTVKVQCMDNTIVAQSITNPDLDDDSHANSQACTAVMELPADVSTLCCL
jgi:hypothetical protein